MQTDKFEGSPDFMFSITGLGKSEVDPE